MIQIDPHLGRQSTLDHQPPDMYVQYDKDDVDGGDHDHLGLEDGPAVRQEWVGLGEQHSA